MRELDVPQGSNPKERKRTFLCCCQGQVRDEGLRGKRQGEGPIWFKNTAIYYACSRLAISGCLAYRLLRAYYILGHFSTCAYPPSILQLQCEQS